MRRSTLLAVVLAVLIAACGEQVVTSPDPTTAPEGSTPEATSAAADPGSIWFEVLRINEQSPDEIGTLRVVEDASALATEWARHFGDAAPPEVDFAEHIVLVVTRPEDDCPDDLVEIRDAEGELHPTFVPPAGACTQPLNAMAYAITLHRADLGEAATIRFAEFADHGAEPVHELTLPPYDGPPAPAAPEVPAAMTDADLDAVFADHPIRRCDELDDPFETYLGDKEIPATPAAKMLDPEVPEDIAGPYAAEHADTIGWFMVDQADATWIVAVTDDVAGHQARLAERHPDHNFLVIETPFTQQEIDEAQEAITPLHGDGSTGIWSSSQSSGRVNIGIIDPAREDLDAIAAVLDDPAIACVEVDLSGL